MPISPDLQQLLDAIPTPLEPLYSHRVEEVRIELLDSDEQRLQDVDAEKVKLDFSVYDTIRTGGSMSVSGTNGIQWLNKRVRITYRATFPMLPGVPEYVRPLGVFIPSSPHGPRGAKDKTRDIELYDKLLILQQDTVGVTYEIPAGSVVVDKIIELIESTGEPRESISIAEAHDPETDAPETLSAAMTFEAGTTKLQIVNRLLETINYFSLWCDGNGVYRGDKYVRPSSRPVSSFGLIEGRDSVYLEDFSDDEDDFAVPNRVILISRVEGDAVPFTSTAENTDPAHPFSWQNRGERWVTYIETDVEATSQLTLDEQARKRLIDLSAQTRTYEVSHALLPYELNEVVVFHNPTNDIIRAHCTVQKMTFDLTLPGAMMMSTIREVTGFDA